MTARSVPEAPASVPAPALTTCAPSVRPPQVEWLLPLRARSAGRARALLREQAAAWGVPGDPTDTAVLLLSELVTNACRHARVPPDGRVGIRFVLLDGLMRIEVSDPGAGEPRLLRTDPDDESGRGLELVTALAASWGIQPRAGGVGKTVWLELALPAADRPTDGE
ncbi:ATP-binding protein [Kitasatospora sp. NPDC050543]|uniref:ATP-binding protein n=1 Tax=Kitasatospora sp. NPDC050543 TaxID=3364054 RepID=UPI00378B8E83